MPQNSQSTKSTKKYFWLRLHHDFFNRDEIRIIESQHNGKDYIIFYLKLMLKSINNDGKLLFKDTIPYTPEMLASITNTSIDTVRVAIDAFVKLGLITMLDDGALHMQEVQKLVGSETADAERKRIERANKKTVPQLAVSDNEQTKSGHCPENVTLENRDKSLDNRNNTPLPPKGENGDGGSVWLQIAKNLDLVFSDDEQSAISRWAEYITSKQKSITVLQIETNLHSLAKHKADGFDICSLINDTISAGYKWLLKPSAMYIKKAASSKPVKVVKPHRFRNPEYIIPESPAEKAQLARYIQSCYHNRINPKNNQPLTASEIRTIDAHRKLFSSQDKNANGVFINYVSWSDYILQNEVHTEIPLVDQYIDDASPSSKQSEA